MWSLWVSIALAAPIEVDRVWEVVAPPVGTEGSRKALRFVSEQLGERTVELAGVAVTAERVRGWTEAPPDEPLLRVVREDTGRPIDLGDLLYLFSCSPPSSPSSLL